MYTLPQILQGVNSRCQKTLGCREYSVQASDQVNTEWENTDVFGGEGRSSLSEARLRFFTRAFLTKC